jgi:hypothetical protein
MGMTNNLPVATKEMLISLYDERLNMFVSKDDMGYYMEILGAVVSDFIMMYPIAHHVLNWPPTEIILEHLSTLSPVRTLYDSLATLLSETGYPVTVINNLSVVHHAPRENTVIKTSSHLRLGRLH